MLYSLGQAALGAGADPGTVGSWRTKLRQLDASAGAGKYRYSLPDIVVLSVLSEAVRMTGASAPSLIPIMNQAHAVIQEFVSEFEAFLRVQPHDKDGVPAFGPYLLLMPGTEQGAILVSNLGELQYLQDECFSRAGEQLRFGLLFEIGLRIGNIRHRLAKGHEAPGGSE